MRSMNICLTSTDAKNLPRNKGTKRHGKHHPQKYVRGNWRKTYFNMKNKLRTNLRSLDMRLVSVPIIDDDMRLPDTFEDLILLADGRSRLYETAREGIVFVAKEAIHPDARPVEKYQGRLSFKVISNKFILKHDA